MTWFTRPQERFFKNRKCKILIQFLKKKNEYEYAKWISSVVNTNSTSTIRCVHREIKRTRVCMPRHLATFSEFTFHLLTLNINETFKKCENSGKFILNLLFLICALLISVREHRCQSFNLQVLDVLVSKDFSWLSKDHERHTAIHLYPHTYTYTNTNHTHTHTCWGGGCICISQQW